MPGLGARPLTIAAPRPLAGSERDVCGLVDWLCGGWGVVRDAKEDGMGEMGEIGENVMPAINIALWVVC